MIYSDHWICYIFRSINFRIITLIYYIVFCKRCMIIGIVLLFLVAMAQERPDLTAVWEQRESDLLDGSPPGDWHKENEHLKEKFLIGICGNELGGEEDPRRRLYNSDPMQLIIKYAMGHSECTVYREEMLGGIGYKTSAEFALELDEATAYG